MPRNFAKEINVNRGVLLRSMLVIVAMLAALALAGCNVDIKTSAGPSSHLTATANAPIPTNATLRAH